MTAKIEKSKVLAVQNVRILMSRKGQSITLSLFPKDKQQLEALALEFGIKWGDKPNISKLVEAIARRELILGNNNDWSPDRITALNRAIACLIDAGQTESAQQIAKLLLERGETDKPLRAEIQKLLESPLPAWRSQIDAYIKRQQPFQLSYQDAADRVWNFTVCHAKVSNREKRQYLDCWCQETAGNTDIEPLQHNWNFRLDRIQDASVSAIKEKWRSHLAEVEVEMHLHNGLAFAYQPKAEDLVNEWLIEKPKTKKVVRKVSFTFWFIREIMQYGKSCEIISPEAIRDRHIQEIKGICNRYELI